MPITLTFDIEQGSVADTNDRQRIIECFSRFGWEHIGGSTWRYPALGADQHPSEDWFNHVIPALMYFRSLVTHAGIRVNTFTLDAHSEAGYRGNALQPIGQPIQTAQDIELYDYEGSALSDERLKRFIQDCSDSLG